jgi:predicted Zn finger-like uncharacterized protein
MYTQCPECHVAFRVTAEILKQAAGKVRCGGCGVAFNALEYLSEQKPRAPVRDDPLPQLPELTPDDPGELEADEPPATISAEQSAALLKTLDQLAGEDIRIEDTGVEWRVIGADVDDDEPEPQPDASPREDEPDAANSSAETGSLKFFIDDAPEPLDEVLEESPTPVDELLTASPTDVDAPEIFEEMRFDDNTPLPDDFELDAPVPPPEPVAEAPVAVEPPEHLQTDLELGNPGDWEELLDEFGEPELASVEPERDEPDAAAVQSWPEPVEELLDVDTQFALQAEALGISPSGLHEAVDEEAAAEPEAVGEAAAVDEPAEEPETSIDEDLIAAAFQSEAAAREAFAAEEGDEPGHAFEPEPLPPEPKSAADPGFEAEPETEAGSELAAGAEFDADYELEAEPEFDTEPELETEPEAEAVAGLEPGPDFEAEPGFEAGPEAHAEPEFDAEPGLETEPGFVTEHELDAEPGFETEPAFEAEVALDTDRRFEAEADLGPEPGFEAEPRFEAELEYETEPGLEAELESEADAELESEPEDAGEEEDIPIELDEAADDEELMADFREIPVDERSLEIRLDDDDEPAETGTDEHRVPEMTEEEKTINMLIDQDLLSVAVEDEDGFASTIVQVQPDKKIRDELAQKSAASGEEDEPEAEKTASTGNNPLVETIIMEGEAVRAPQDRDKHEKNRRLGEELKAKRAEEELRNQSSGGASRVGMIAAAVLLVLVLLLQFVHQSRETLATIPAFNEAVGPIYRMLGKPLTPAWDIKGWRFEATKGSTDDLGERLTIYSRVGNNSDTPLPYPLVHVSLTDRFEDIIGSRVLEPGEYLGSDADPRQLVAAGDTFNAVISIEAPAPEATGFKLNVCYRLASSQLRCAIEDFK